MIIQLELKSLQIGRKLRSSVLRAFAAACLGLGLVLVPAGAPAFAFALNENECTSYCYSIGTQQGSFAGVEGQWDDRVITLPATEAQNFYHLNNEMWLITSSGPFVEEGLSYQCTKPPQSGKTCTGIGGTAEYLQFWGDEGTSGDPAFHVIDTLSPDGGNHVYEIWDSSNCANNDFNVYLDYDQIGTSIVTGQCQSSYINAGLELLSPGINSGRTGGTETRCGRPRYVEFSPACQHSGSR